MPLSTLHDYTAELTDDLELPQGVLAFATGGIAGIAGTYVVARQVWVRAQKQGELADSHAHQLHELSGLHDDEPKYEKVRRSFLLLSSCVAFSLTRYPSALQPIVVPSLLDLRLRRDLSASWNAQVVSFYEAAKRWC